MASGAGMDMSRHELDLPEVGMAPEGEAITKPSSLFAMYAIRP